MNNNGYFISSGHMLLFIAASAEWQEICKRTLGSSSQGLDKDRLAYKVLKRAESRLLVVN